ncbi:MAG: hypothetical protein ACI9DF_004482 [Verrucomicrobiales bacterium]|jgi:hypothetical protein
MRVARLYPEFPTLPALRLFSFLEPRLGRRTILSPPLGHQFVHPMGATFRIGDGRRPLHRAFWVHRKELLRERTHSLVACRGLGQFDQPLSGRMLIFARPRFTQTLVDFPKKLLVLKIVRDDLCGLGQLLDCLIACSVRTPNR